MKVFGHHVALPAAMLAMIDGVAFLVALYVLGLTGTCSNCYLHSVTHLEAHEGVLLATAFVVITASVGVYNRDALLSFRVFLGRFALAAQFVFLPAVLFVGVAKATAGLPFGWFIGIVSIAIAVFLLVVLLLRIVALRAFDLEAMKRRVFVVGGGPVLDSVLGFLDRHASGHLRCVGHLKNGRSELNAVSSVGNLAIKTQPEPRAVPLALIAQSLRADEIVVAVANKRGLPMWQLLECKLRGIQITDYLEFWERETGQIDLNQVGPGWLALSHGFRLNWIRRIIKRSIDIAVSMIILILFLPVGLLVALLIRLDSKGPIFYRQERVGQDGRTFRIWKFRSMRVDAENDGVPRWATVGDDRTTRIGRLIRKLRLDEFPQIINVLNGDMSFIGPRPERPYFVEQLRREIPFYDIRHRVQPGITGWAQVNYPYGASIEDAKRKLAFDLYYVKNQDSFLDVIVLMQTVRVFLFSHGSR
jgi:sugar transferase (PEP-CTERM system associated)